jgi:ribose transport system permease protein
MALGVFFVILTSGIDLSIGSVVGLSGVLCGLALAAGLPPVLGVIVGLLAGALIGSINGAIVAYVGVTPFIVTLGMLSMARGAVLVLTHGDSIRGIPESFINAGRMNVLGLPMPVVVLAVMAVASHVTLTCTAFGRRVYALGGNEEATALSGVHTRRVKFATYVLSSVFSAVTGILFIARFETAQASAGFGMELDAIAAAVIGGASLLGAQGTVAGVLLGATIMGVIRDGLVLMKAPSHWQELIIGSIIVLAAVLDLLRSRRR